MSSGQGVSDLVNFQRRPLTDQESERSIPSGLTFEDIINNRALPPCSLNDFMDYLVHIEHNAENLQFFLWYQDYLCRFNALPTHQQALSLEWIPQSNVLPRLPVQEFEKSLHLKGKRDILDTMMEYGYATRESTLFGHDVVRPLSAVEGSDASAVTCAEAEIIELAGMKWQPFTIQPFRDEINCIIRQYLDFSAPRELNLSYRDISFGVVINLDLPYR